MPRWASTIAFTIGSPSPDPPVSRVRDSSPRLNRSNACATSAGGKPGSVVVDRQLDPGSGCIVDERDGHRRRPCRRACAAARWTAGWSPPGGDGAVPAHQRPARQAATAATGGPAPSPARRRPPRARAGSGRRSRTRADGLRRVARAGAGRRPGPSSAPTRRRRGPSRAAAGRARCRRRPGLRRLSSAYPAIVDSGVRSSCDASATNCRTCCSLSWRASSARSTWPSIRLSASPELTDLVVGMGVLLRDPGGGADGSGVQRRPGDFGGGCGDLAQRPELAANQSEAGDRRETDTDQRDDRLQADQPTQRLVDIAGRQPGHEDQPIRLVQQHPVGADTGKVDRVRRPVSRDRGKRHQARRRTPMSAGRIARPRSRRAGSCCRGRR